MTEKEMNKLADIVVNKLLEKQKEYDENFKNEVQKIVDQANDEIIFNIENVNDPLKELKDRMVEIELEELENLLKLYVEREDYENAKIIKSKIDRLNGL